MNKVQKSKFASIILIICLFAASSGILIAISAPASLSYTTTIEPGSLTKIRGYYAFKDGSTYYAINGTTGALYDSGTNASDVYNNCTTILHDNDGGVLHFLGATTYTFDTPLYQGDKTTIEGEGWGTELETSGEYAVIDTRDNEVNSYMMLRDIQIDGNFRTNTNSSGVIWRGAYMSIISDVRIIDCNIYGLAMIRSTDTTKHCHDNAIYNVFILNFNGTGFYAYGGFADARIDSMNVGTQTGSDYCIYFGGSSGAGVFLSNIHYWADPPASGGFIGTQPEGIHITSSCFRMQLQNIHGGGENITYGLRIRGYNNKLTTWNCVKTKTAGIYLDGTGGGAHGNIITGIHHTRPYGYAVLLDGYNNILQGGTFEDCRSNTFYFDGEENTTVSGMNIKDADGRAFYAISPSDYLTITNNVVYNCDENGIYLSGVDNGIVSNNLVKNNTKHGISLYQSHMWSVTGNHVSWNSKGTANYDGILISESDNNTLTGNVCHDNGRNQIHVDTFLAEFNVIIGNTAITGDGTGNLVVDDATNIYQIVTFNQTFPLNHVG